jgi:hypothetical protein
MMRDKGSAANAKGAVNTVRREIVMSAFLNRSFSNVVVAET